MSRDVFWGAAVVTVWTLVIWLAGYTNGRRDAARMNSKHDQPVVYRLTERV